MIKKILKIILGIFGLLFILFFSGPKVEAPILYKDLPAVSQNLTELNDWINSNEDTISKTQDQWEYFLQDPARNFQDCDWTLDAISPGSMETNAARKASKKSAELSFQRFFNNPDIMDGIHVTDYMMGPDVFEYRTAKMSKAFPNSETKYLPGELVGNQGVNTLNIRKHDHSQIRFLRGYLGLKATFFRPIQ